MSSGNWRAIVNSFSLQRIAFTCAKIREFGNNLRKQRVKFSNFDLKRRNLWNVSHLLIQARLKKWKILGFCRFFPSLQNFFEHDSFLIIHPSCPPPSIPNSLIFISTRSPLFSLSLQNATRNLKNCTASSTMAWNIWYFLLSLWRGRGWGSTPTCVHFQMLKRWKLGW